VAKFCGLLFGVLVMSIVPGSTFAQGSVVGGPRCFSIRMQLNGQDIAGPQAVTLKVKSAEETVALQNNCFPVPSAMLHSELLELSFTLPGNNIHLSNIPADFFNGSWEIQLADKKFPKSVSIPKHANVAEVCALTVLADSEQSLAQPQCRSAVTVTATAAAKQ
jgi:hypothetical protein